ncbi:MAG: DegT/DnrJ/EryC1/StrS aminotransferase family protein [Thermoguttaceae bacterium]|nr:DegT/DnrJ/EryC1/StrS aminotransferase family protein [Thermoguttaceae bacterium]
MRSRCRRAWRASLGDETRRRKAIRAGTAERRTLQGRKVFRFDFPFDASINPVAYEDGEVVLIDTERETWNKSPEVIEKAFELYPDVMLVVIAHLYGTPSKMKSLGSFSISVSLRLWKTRMKLLVRCGLAGHHLCLARRCC